MNSLRKVLGFAMTVLVLGAFALSSGAATAADKTYQLTLSPAAGTSPIATMTATLTNKGNSSFNSFTLTLPVNYSLLGTPTVSASKGTVSYNPATRVITVLNIGLPVGSGTNQIVTVTMANVATSGASCATGVPGNWTAAVWTGSTLNGSPFGNFGTYPVPTSINPLCYTVSGSTSAGGTVTCTPSPVAAGGSSICSVAVTALYTFTGFSANCGAPTTATSCTVSNVQSSQTVTASFVSNTLAITSAPTSAAVGTPFDVTIGSTPAGADVSFAAGCDASSSKTTTATGTTFTITIKPLPAPPSTCTITFTAPNYNQIQLPNLQVYKGVLFCGDYDSVNGPGDTSYDPDLPSSLSGLGSSYVGTPGWGLRRGPNKDGSACVKVNYSCNLDTATSPNVATCTFDKASGQLATFRYLFLWSPKTPDASGWTSYRPQVSWNIASPDSSYVLPDWVPLLACIDDQIPAVPTTILPVIPGVAPFTNSGNTRAQYQPGQTALVCGAQQGWTSMGTPGNPLLQIWNIVIDESDLKVQGP
jgi:hypothetical protein